MTRALPLAPVRYGPRGIREASIPYAWYRSKGFFIYRQRTMGPARHQMGDVGDVDVEPMDFTTTFGRITETIRAIRRKNALPVAWRRPFHLLSGHSIL